MVQLQSKSKPNGMKSIKSVNYLSGKILSLRSKISTFRNLVGNYSREVLYWQTLKKIPLTKIINLGSNGGSLVQPCYNENKVLTGFIALQTAGMFKSEIYNSLNGIQHYLSKTKQDGLFCLTKFDLEGEIVWQKGSPYKGKLPYLSHSPEHMMKTYDIDGDGKEEILVLSSRDELLVYSDEGDLIKRIKLPNDSFSQLYVIPSRNSKESFRILIGVMDRSYDGYEYANPWILLNERLEITKEFEAKGAGHNIYFEDINSDGENEILIGYELFDFNASRIWTVDYWVSREMNSLEQHADWVEGIWWKSKWYGIIAGSDQQYLINMNGKVIWKKTLPHPQACSFGTYEDDLYIFVANQRESMDVFDLAGNQVNKTILPEHWPNGKPAFINPVRPIHVSNPIQRLPSAKGSEPSNAFIYIEGGWPYIANYLGKPVAKFEPGNNEKFKFGYEFYRANDIGGSFDIIIPTGSFDKTEELFIYNRTTLFQYKMGNFHK